jgi:F-type H+-transporting ATPase subunit epsilon
MNEFVLTIVTQDKKLFEGKVVSARVPAAGGDLGVLANHAPLLAALRQGVIRLRKKSGEAITVPIADRGFLKVAKNEAAIVCVD